MGHKFDKKASNWPKLARVLGKKPFEKTSDRNGILVWGKFESYRSVFVRV